MMTFFLQVNQCCQKGRKHVMGHRCFHKWSFDWGRKKKTKKQKRSEETCLRFRCSIKFPMGCSPAEAQRKRSVTIRSSLLPTFLHFLLSGFYPSCLGGERRVLSDVEERKPKGGCDLPAKMGRKKKKKKLPRCECLLQKTRSLSFPPLYPGLQIATTQFSIREAPAKYKV